MNNLGWIKFHRKILDSPIWKDITAKHVFEYLILTADHRTGEGIYGRIQASNNCGLPEGTFYSAVKRLSNKYRMIEQNCNNKSTAYRIVNWLYYQDEKSSINTKSTTNQHQINTIQELRTKESNNKLFDMPSMEQVKKPEKPKKQPDLGVNAILDGFNAYAGHEPTDRKPRFAANTFKKQILTLIKDIAPYKELVFADVVKESFAWYERNSGSVRAETIDTIRRKVTRIMFEGTRQKYIPNYKLNSAT